MLETVGLGAGAELVAGAGAGAELGGASVGVGAELCGLELLELLELLGALDEGAGLGDFEEFEPVEEAVAGWSGCALGCTPGAVIRAVRCRRWPGDVVGDPAEEAETDGSVLGAVLT